MRRRLLVAFEKAELETDPKTAQGAADLRHHRRRRDRRRARRRHHRAGARSRCRTTSATSTPQKARVVLIEAGPRVLANFRRRSVGLCAAGAARSSASRSCSAQAVTAVHADGVVYGGERLDAETIIWAAGVRASPAAEWLGAPADRAGRVKVEPDLSVPGHPEIFAIGDTVDVAGPTASRCPASATPPSRGDATPPDVIKARLRGEQRSMPFHYKHPGNIAHHRQQPAVIDFGWIKLTRLDRLVDLGPRPHLLPDRAQEPALHRAQLAVDLPQRPAQRAADHARQQQGGSLTSAANIARSLSKNKQPLIGESSTPAQLSRQYSSKHLIRHINYYELTAPCRVYTMAHRLLRSGQNPATGTQSIMTSQPIFGRLPGPKLISDRGRA